MLASWEMVMGSNNHMCTGSTAVGVAGQQRLPAVLAKHSIQTAAAVD
jgi:hypothetical protein